MQLLETVYLFILFLKKKNPVYKVKRFPVLILFSTPLIFT